MNEEQTNKIIEQLNKLRESIKLTFDAKEAEINQLQEDNYELRLELESEKEKYRIAIIHAREYKAWVENAEVKIKRLLVLLEETTHHGHASWCNSVKGPEGNNWYEEDKCNCSLKEALEEGK